jgi:hypothetical protein
MGEKVGRGGGGKEANVGRETRGRNRMYEGVKEE